MPIYEFVCDKCGKDSELLVRSSNWEGSECPHCGSKKLKKKLSVFASAVAGAGEAPAACGMSPKSCGCCCGGRSPHSH